MVSRLAERDRPNVASPMNMNALRYVPAHEFAQVMKADCSPFARTAAFATLCRINTLYMIARAGSGHIGTSFSSLDIVSWLYLNELRRDDEGTQTAQRDIYFSSKGHDAPGLYSILTACNRLDFDLIHRLRRLDGLPGHPDVSTPGIATNTGSLGMGISKAKGMVAANRLARRDGRVFVLFGDGELQEGQFWESLVSAANQGMAEITAIIDHNKIQSDTWINVVSDLGDIDEKFRAFGWHVQRCDGHDLPRLADCIAKTRAEKRRPNVIIADTIKGAGVSFMEWGDAQRNELLYPFHSGAPAAESYARAIEELAVTAEHQLRVIGVGLLELVSVERTAGSRPVESTHLIPAYAAALLEQGHRNSRLVSLDADLVFDTGQIPFREAFPDRFIECGIAEQDMVSQAGGLALQGFVPVVHSFACFLSTRPNEQIFNNATERRKIIYVGSLAGLLPGGPGHSHQCVRDISALGAIPGLVLIEPCCASEVASALDYAVYRNEGSTYLRLVSIPCELPIILPDDYALTRGRGVTVLEGHDAVVIGYGPVLLAEAIKAANLVHDRYGLTLRIINLPWLNCVDAEWLGRQLWGVKHLFTLDNHFLRHGQGEMIAAAVAELGLVDAPSIMRFGVETIPACGSNDEVLAHHGLDAGSIAERIAQAMELA